MPNWRWHIVVTQGDPSGFERRRASETVEVMRQCCGWTPTRNRGCSSSYGVVTGRVQSVDVLENVPYTSNIPILRTKSGNYPVKMLPTGDRERSQSPTPLFQVEFGDTPWWVVELYREIESVDCSTEVDIATIRATNYESRKQDNREA